MRLKMKVLEHDRPVTLSVCGMELTIDGMEKEEVLTIVADERGVAIHDNVVDDQPQAEQTFTATESTVVTDDITIPVIATPHEGVALLPEKTQARISDNELFRQLSALRKQLSAKQGLPPYVVFNDRSLREMVEKLPEDLATFSSISGVGKSKLEKYGALFLDTIRTYKGNIAG